jgi:hypothetical protein
MRQSQHEAPVAGGIAARRIACVNESDAAVPVYSIVAAPGGYTKPHSSSTREYMQIDYPTGSNDALFVTMGKSLGGYGSNYGHVWSVLAGPLWMNYEGDTPSIGDIVGPKADSFKVSTEGSGFKVLQVNAAKERVRAVFLGGSGGGAGMTLVTITEIFEDCDCMAASCTVVAPGCSESLSVGDVITAIDRSECVLSGAPPAELEGKNAWVTRTKTEAYAEEVLPEGCDLDDNPYTETDETACHWTFVLRCC